MNMNRKLKIILAIVTVAVLVSAGYFVYKRYHSAAPEVKNENSAIQNVLPESIKPETNGGYSAQGGPAVGWKLYKNSDFGFEIQYPDSWTVSKENIVNVRGENTKGFFFKKPNSDLRFAILPRDGLSYGLPENGTTTEVMIGGSLGAQSKWTLPDGRRLWLIHPQYGLFDWAQDIGRIDILSSATDPTGDTKIFEQMLNSFKLAH